MSGEQPRQMLLSARSKAMSSGERGVPGFDGSRGTSPALGCRWPSGAGACACAAKQPKAAESTRALAQPAAMISARPENLRYRIIRLLFPSCSRGRSFLAERGPVDPGGQGEWRSEERRGIVTPNSKVCSRQYEF